MAEGKGPKQRLAAILAADVAGYSRLMQADERATIATLNEYRGLFRAEIETHDGRVVDMAGDSVLAVFDSAIGAVSAAVAIQGELAKRNEALPEDRRMAFRVGVNLGDIFEQADGTVYGDGVNVAARLEALASPGGINVSGSVFDSVRSKVDASFDFLGEQEVKNIADPVRAYRVADGEAAPPVKHQHLPKPKLLAGLAAAAALVVVVAGLWGAGVFDTTRPAEDVAEAEPSAASPWLAFPNKASVAVLPFDNLSTDPEHAFIADGLHENVTATLSQAYELFVPARYSTLQYKETGIDIAEVTAQLGVGHLLEGSVQVSGDQLRITMQLIEARSGGHIWTERYDRPIEDIFAIQDEIALEVATAMQINLLGGGRDLKWRGGTKNLEAWALSQEGAKNILKYSEEANDRARELLERAVAIDPNYALAWGRLAWVHWHAYEYGWDTEPSVLARCKEYTDKVLALAPDHAYGYRLLRAIASTEGDHGAAMKWGKKAIDLAPNSPDPRADMAWVYIRAGEYDQALKSVEEAMRLSPAYPAWYIDTKATAISLLGDWNQAADLFAEYYGRAPDDFARYFNFSIVLANANRLDDLKAEIARASGKHPDYSIETIRDFAREKLWFYETTIVENALDELRSLGVPEHPPRADADKPSIAVLPFENLSGDPEQDYFAKGIAEELITTLSRFSDIRVAARGRSLEMAENDPVVVARELKVGFVLGGSVRRSGDTIRISAHLADVDGNQVWADRFERSLNTAGIFAIQDEIAIRIANSVGDMDGEMIRDTLRRLQRVRAQDLGHYECVLRSLDVMTVVTHQNHAETRDCLEAAVAANPNFADAWAALIWIYSLEHQSGLNPRPRPLERALDAGQKALAIDPNHPDVPVALAAIHFARHDLDQFFDLAEQEIDRNPDDISVLADLGWKIAYAGRWERGIGLLERVLEIHPDHATWIYIAFSIDKYRRHDYEGALADAQRINMHDYWRDPFVTTIALAQLGRIDEARQSLDRMLELHPAFAEDPWGECRKWNWSEDLIAHILDGFKKAGLEIPPDPTG